MKYTRKYLEESSIHEGLGSSVAKLLYGVGGPLAAVAGIPTLATMAQDIGLAGRQRSWTLQGAKAGFGQGSSRGQDIVSRAIIGNLPISSELSRMLVFPSQAGRPTWTRRSNRKRPT